ncbi:MAG TPA: HAD-IB family hydrolase [Candidatus Nanopelagicales bacterium]|nr:HAD-IB family hydrolase [Candidatus Nanopelagicales bacterium]
MSGPAERTPAEQTRSRPAEPGRRRLDAISASRLAGKASAAVAEVGDQLELPMDPSAAAFFDVDNTVMRGASIFHLARGLAKRRFFTAAEVSDFVWKQAKFVIGGSEDLEDMASATESALQFVKGRRVQDINALGEEIFDELMSRKLWPGTLALTKAHLDKGQRVWLVTATPVELATLIARRLGLTGALGTVSEIEDGIYTGRLVGAPLHGKAKAEAVIALAEREGLDLTRCAAYSDSANDVPMLSLVGRAVAVNPDSTLRTHARAVGWEIHDYRRQRFNRRYGIPVAVAAIAGAGIGAGLGIAAVNARRTT